jgi:hypothetical protein
MLYSIFVYFFLDDIQTVLWLHKLIKVTSGTPTRYIVGIYHVYTMYIPRGYIYLVYTRYIHWILKFYFHGFMRNAML